MGIGSSSSSLYPTQVVGLEYVVAIAAGARHSLALDRLGNLYAWGYNGVGQLGNGPTLTQTPTSTSTPVPAATGHCRVDGYPHPDPNQHRDSTSDPHATTDGNRNPDTDLGPARHCGHRCRLEPQLSRAV